MAKRRMPKHIVLPNGMWRFVKSGSSTKRVSHKRRARKAAPVHTMARRKHYGKSFRRSLKAGLSVKNVALGAAVTAVIEPYFDSMILNPIRMYIPAVPAGAAKALIGYYLNKKMKGIIKGVGLSLMVLGINDTVQSLGIGLPQTSATGVIV